jgi:hypothetical protein
VADFRKVIAFVQSRDVGALFTTEAFSRLEMLTERLPEAMASYYLECRLGGDCDQVDLMGCVRSSDRGRESLNQYLHSDARFGNQQAWELVKEFCRSWSTPESPVHELIPHLWLSFDLVESSQAFLSPNLLICVDPARFFDGRPWRSSRLTDDEFRMLASVIFEKLLRRNASSGERRTLRLCHEVLQAGEQLAHISVMLSRNPVACKIDVALPPTALLSYLARVNWPGSVSTLKTLLSRFCYGRDQIAFQLVLGESVAPTIELELHFDDSTDSQGPYRLLLESLRESGLCTEAKMTALSQWRGQFRLPSPGEKWPTRWRAWTDLKIVQAANCEITAKGYIGLASSSSLI